MLHAQPTALRLALFGLAATSTLALSGCSTWNPWGDAEDAPAAQTAESTTEATPETTTDAAKASSWTDKLAFWRSDDEPAEAPVETAPTAETPSTDTAQETGWTDKLAFWRSGDDAPKAPAAPAPAFPRDASVSYAKNVLDLFALERIADRPYDPALPADMDANVPFVPQAVEGDPLATPKSANVLGVSVSMNWSRNLKDAVMPSSPEELKSRLMGFVDASLQPDRPAAQKAFAQQVSDAMVAALTDEGFEAVRIEPSVRGTYTVDGYTWTAVTFADPARGCPKPAPHAGEGLRPEGERCRIVFTVADRTVEEEPLREATPWLGLPAEPTPLWVFRTTNLTVTLTDAARDDHQLDLAPLYHAIVKHLPAGTHLYAAPVRTPAGWLEPYVLESRGTHRFRAAAQ